MRCSTNHHSTFGVLAINMTTLKLFLTIAGCSLIINSGSSAEGIESRQYLPAAAPVLQRKLLLYPSYYKPFYNQYQQTYYPQYTSSYSPQYNDGFIGGYQQQALGQQITSGTSFGGYQKPALGQQIAAGASLGGYQKPVFGPQIASGASLAGYHKPALGQQINSAASLGGYQKPALETQFSSGTSLDLSGLGLSGYYPNLNLDLVAALKPNALQTVSDTISGSFVYGKKK